MVDEIILCMAGKTKKQLRVDDDECMRAGFQQKQARF